jgi:hypothetical protein
MSVRNTVVYQGADKHEVNNLTIRPGQFEVGCVFSERGLSSTIYEIYCNKSKCQPDLISKAHNEMKQMEQKRQVKDRLLLKLRMKQNK